MNTSKKRVYVAMSGGVDSSVAAALLLKEGYEVRGVFMHCWDENDPICTVKQDKKDALRIAAHLNIPIQIWDFRKEYKKEVYDEFVKSYEKGTTPNPDIWCNTKIKFGIFYDRVKAADENAIIATGHYARKKTIKGESYLQVAKDKKKDQSYFLYQVESTKLKDIEFPLGTRDKDKVRQLARRLALHVRDKPDSQGICFIGRTSLSSVLTKQVEVRSGAIINLAGTVLSASVSIKTATIGQRHGFMSNSDINSPLYVIDKDHEKDLLIVDDRQYAFFDEFMINELYLPNKCPLDLTRKMYIRVRHLGGLTFAKIQMDKTVAYIKLNKPEFGVAPGQHAVIYDSDGVIRGGGEISNVNTKYKKKFSAPILGT